MNATKKTNRKKLYLLSYLTIIMISGANVGTEANERLKSIDEKEAFKNVKSIDFPKIKFYDHIDPNDKQSYSSSGAYKLYKILKYDIICNRALFDDIKKTDVKSMKVDDPGEINGKTIEYISIYEIIKYAWGFYHIGDKKKDKNPKRKEKFSNKGFDSFEEAKGKGGIQSHNFYIMVDEAIKIHFKLNKGFHAQYNSNPRLKNAIGLIMPRYIENFGTDIENSKNEDKATREIVHKYTLTQSIDLAKKQQISSNGQTNTTSRTPKQQNNNYGQNDPKEQETPLLPQNNTNNEMETPSRQESSSSLPLLLTATAIVGGGVAAMSRKSKSSVQNKNKNKKQNVKVNANN